jgi:hypothetical protein
MNRKLKKREKDALSAVAICFTVLVPIEILSTLIATYKFASYPQFSATSKLVIFLGLARATKISLLSCVFGGPLLLGVIIYFLCDLLPKKEVSKLDEQDKSTPR